MKANWNKEIDKIIDFLDNIDLEEINEREEPSCDEKLLEELIRWRQGTK